MPEHQWWGRIVEVTLPEYIDRQFGWGSGGVWEIVCVKSGGYSYSHSISGDDNELSFTLAAGLFISFLSSENISFPQRAQKVRELMRGNDQDSCLSSL